MIVDYYVKSRINQQEYEELHELVAEEKNNTSKTQNKSKKVDKLKKINGDAVGWVNVPGTKISYPVVKAKNNEFYLNRNFKREYSAHGVPFVDYRVDLKQKNYQNVIVYAHHMKDGSMFAGLNKYLDKAQYKKNKYVFFETSEGRRKFQIISVYKIDAGKEYGQNLAFNFKTKKEFNEYVDTIKEKSFYSIEMPKKYKNNLVSLCTCEYTLDDGRLIVSAIEI